MATHAPSVETGSKIQHVFVFRRNVRNQVSGKSMAAPKVKATIPIRLACLGWGIRGRIL
jgi:hypothetical protein